MLCKEGHLTLPRRLSEGADIEPSETNVEEWLGGSFQGEEEAGTEA